MPLTTTRRSLLRAAACLPATFALSAQYAGTWQARCRSYLTLASQAKSGPPQVLHAETAKLALGQPIDPAVFNSVLDLSNLKVRPFREI